MGQENYKGKRNLHLLIEPDTLKTIKHTAAEDDVSLSKVVEVAVTFYYELRKKLGKEALCADKLFVPKIASPVNAVKR